MRASCSPLPRPMAPCAGSLPACANQSTRWLRTRTCGRKQGETSRRSISLALTAVSTCRSKVRPHARSTNLLPYPAEQLAQSDSSGPCPGRAGPVPADSRSGAPACASPRSRCRPHAPAHTAKRLPGCGRAAETRTGPGPCTAVQAAGCRPRCAAAHTPEPPQPTPAPISVMPGSGASPPPPPRHAPDRRTAGRAKGDLGHFEIRPPQSSIEHAVIYPRQCAPARCRRRVAA